MSEIRHFCKNICEKIVYNTYISFDNKNLDAYDYLEMRKKMSSLLIAIIYLAFISLGLPDSLIGSAWPVMHTQLNVPTSYAGIVTMLIAGGTIVSSLFSDRLTRKFGAGVVTSCSVFLTALALLGFSMTHSFAPLCIWAIPYGLGAGAVDAALNNYVALHFKARHMSWLHCFWGVGASISPYIMSYSLTGGMGWEHGYRIVGILQIGLTAILFLSLPLWKNRKGEAAEGTQAPRALRFGQAVRIKGVPMILFTFFAYCALESSAGLWASSYLVQARGADPIVAAKFAALFYMGITFGRFLSGFISEKMGDKKLIRTGILIVAAGCVLVMIPFSTDIPALTGLIIIGLGCAPIYPSVIHATPYNFGRENSQAIIGIQMASAYAGSTFMPPVFGWISSLAGIGLYPFYLLVFVIIMLLMSEKLNQIIERIS